MLSYLDNSNITSILTTKDFKLNILKDCILLGAQRTEFGFLKLPSALKKAAINSDDFNFKKDFMHPLWVSSTQFLFDLLEILCAELPQAPLITVNLDVNGNNNDHNDYESKLEHFALRHDFYSYLSPITDAINAYLKCIRQYPCLQNQLKLKTNDVKLKNLITFILFQIDFINYLVQKRTQFVSLNSLNQSFLGSFNLLIDQNLLDSLCHQANYSTLVSHLIKDFYQLILFYFFQLADQSLIHTPNITKHNIDYSMTHSFTQDVVFSTHTFDTLLKLRFIITNYRLNSSSSANSSGGGGEQDTNDSLSSMKSTYCANTQTHRFLQHQSNFFRRKFPFNMCDLIEKIYLSICRLPILERFIRIPDSLWRTFGFKLEYSQFLNDNSSIALPPLEYLRDPQILKEHLKHILSVGWTNRTQFEYEYVNLLTLLHNLSDDHAASSSSGNGQHDEQQDTDTINSIPVEEIKERNKCVGLVIKGLSSWLIKSTLAPKSGSSLHSLYEQVSRNKVPQFLQSQLGRQYCQLKRIIESFNRNHLFTKMNSITLANNPQLLYMLDPTLIDEMDRTKRKANLVSSLDFTQQATGITGDALTNLVQISMNLSQRDYNLFFTTNIERSMIANLSSNSDTYFYYTQISLEGHLKFLGQWNRNNSNNNNNVGSAAQRLTSTTAASIAATLSNLSNNSAIVDEVSAKTASALLKVAEFLTDDTDLLGRVNPSLDQETSNPNLIIQTPPQTVLRSFDRNNLDIMSVLRTVLDYYESFFRNSPCLQLKLDIFKSILYLANSLFDSKQQHEALMHKLQNNLEFGLNSFIQQDMSDQSELMPIVNELIDESVLSLAIYAECLCRCCLQTSRNEQISMSMTSKELDRLNKLFENGFKSNSLSIKISTCHGLFYWLESIALGYLINTNDAKLITDHLCKQINHLHLTSVYVSLNSRYVSTLWSAVFYAIENCLDSIREAQSFVSTFIKLTYQMLNDANTPYFLFSQMCMGLERFLLSSMVPSFEMNTIQRMFTSKAYDEQRSLCLTSLIVTSLYSSNHSKQVNYWNDIVKHCQYPLQKQHQQDRARSSSVSASNSMNNFSSATDSLANSPMAELPPDQAQSNTQRKSSNDPMSGYPQILELSAYPDLQSHLLKVLEVATTFLDKIKSSSTAKEASIYASILPKLLCDFLPPHDLLNKLITEFLNSSQHPYPEAVAFILFKCFDLLQEKGLQSQIQEWCLLSLSNFLQRTSIYESIWLTSCLLVSATKNHWLKATFPFLLNRYCAFETIDRAIFYMSVIEFRKQFSDKSQTQSIYSTFESVAKPGTPYDELLKLLSSQQDREEQTKK
jgi:hypothetical protein